MLTSIKNIILSAPENTLVFRATITATGMMMGRMYMS